MVESNAQSVVRNEIEGTGVLWRGDKAPSFLPSDETGSNISFLEPIARLDQHARWTRSRSGLIRAGENWVKPRNLTGSISTGEPRLHSSHQ